MSTNAPGVIPCRLSYYHCLKVGSVPTLGGGGVIYNIGLIPQPDVDLIYRSWWLGYPVIQAWLNVCATQQKVSDGTIPGTFKLSFCANPFLYCLIWCLYVAKIHWTWTWTCDDRKVILIKDFLIWQSLRKLAHTASVKRFGEHFLLPVISHIVGRPEQT